MTDETDATSEVARVLAEHFDPTGAERHDPYALAVYEEAAVALREAGLLREEPFSVEGMEIMSGWLVESAGEHTCGAGGSESGYAHEPGCGYVPVQRLDDLPGWPGAQHQADVEQLGHSIIALLDQVGQLQARLDRLTEESVREAIDDDGHRPGWVSAAVRRVLAIVAPVERDPECPCAACDPGLILDGKPTGLPSRMSVCPDCGNKRCPKAANHARWQCSGSNAVGQVGVPVETKGEADV